MLHPYFDFWANFWRDAAETLGARSEAIEWIVQFGEVEKMLQDVHPGTGLPALIAPLKCRIEERLSGVDQRGICIIFRVDPRRGLVHMLRGPASKVANTEKVLSQR